MIRKVVCVVGTRPNFMKMAPVARELARQGFEPRVVHTGQHYDELMSEVFLAELGMGRPDHLLGAGSGSHTEQTVRVMRRLAPVLEGEAPELMLVAGDVNSTLAAALTGAQMGIPVGHVEAGLRSFDRSMPEELNRVLTDRLSDQLFTHSPEAGDHLLAEGSQEAAIHYVGNTMIDTLVAMRDRIDADDVARRLGLEPGGYVLATLHRPALVHSELLGPVMEELSALAREVPVVFPAHPRTRAAIGRRAPARGLTISEPLGYVEFISLMSDALAVLTDSGGVQEEATFLGVPCLTLRDNTERPVTVSMGTNLVLGLRPERIREVPRLADQIRERPERMPPLWDGRAAERLVAALVRPRVESA